VSGDDGENVEAVQPECDDIERSGIGRKEGW